MKKLLLSMISVAFIFQSYAQQKQAVIDFDNLEHDYGTIKEDGGKADYVFSFTNKGSDTLKLISVRPACGCTTSEYTTTPIMPNKKGFVKASFDPNGRPGDFNKDITVLTNDPNKPNIRLIIKGKVTPKVKTKADNYPQKMGNLRFRSNHLAMQNLVANASKTDTLWYYNEGAKTLNLSLKDVPPHITVKLVPEIIKAGKEAYMLITYNAELRKDWGLIFDWFNLVTNDSVMPEKRINVSANIVDDFTKLTPEQLKNAPKIVFDKLKYDFGNAKTGEVVKYKFVFKNEGNEDLIIHKTKASCGCTATNPDKTLLKKGESSFINAEFNTAGRQGGQNKSITVVTNDPNNSSVTLELSGNVEALQPEQTPAPNQTPTPTPTPAPKK